MAKFISAKEVKKKLIIAPDEQETLDIFHEAVSSGVLDKKQAIFFNDKWYPKESFQNVWNKDTLKFDRLVLKHTAGIYCSDDNRKYLTEEEDDPFCYRFRQPLSYILHTVDYCPNCEGIKHKERFVGGICYDCHESLSYVHGYSYKPFAVDKKDKSRYYGVELELEYPNRDVRGEAARALPKERAIMKRDGSLSNDGGEIVTAPLLFKDQVNFWESIADSLTLGEPKSSCGMHVHVSKVAIPVSAQARIAMFLGSPKNGKFVNFIAGRGVNSYCRREGAASLGALFHFGRFLYTNDRYMAMNISNPQTVEFRLFASSTNVETILARLEFIDALITYMLPGNSFLPVDASRTYKHFVNFIRSRPKAWPRLLIYCEAYYDSNSPRVFKREKGVY